MFAGEFKLRYQVLQNDDGSARRIIFRDIPREMFDVIPVQQRTNLSEPGSGPTFYTKTMQKLGVEWWFWTEEDEHGNIEGVLPPVEFPALGAGVAAETEVA
jgi:hypothetical protein